MNKRILTVLLATLGMIGNAFGSSIDRYSLINIKLLDDTSQLTPLHRAVIEWDVVALTCLLDEGADVNSKAPFEVPGKDLVVNLTPLQTAVICGHVNIGGELLRRGATIETVQGVEDVGGNWSDLASKELLTDLCKCFLATELYYEDSEDCEQ